ncbi:MAG: N-acetyltransferase, partial [Methylomonas sp.]|nr:N-acetyltransferase [Methylomonas sp.]
MALKDGEWVDFRPVKPYDGQTIQNGMRALSDQSRYFRFFSPIVKLSDEQLHYFTEVDQHNHVAWIALAHDKIEQLGVGIARFIRFQHQAHIAEFAVTVVDSYQRRG